MIVDDRFPVYTAITRASGLRVSREGSIDSVDECLQAEHSIAVFINGIETMQLVCSPDHLVELVVGRLFSENIVESIGDIDSIYICQYGTQAKVLLSPGCHADFSRESVESVGSCCTGNRIFNQYFNGSKPLEPVKPIRWDTGWIFSMADQLCKDTPMHSATNGAHSCFLASGDSVVCCREDLGRHNALDKVLGYALMHDVDLTQTMIYSSGRLPLDMVMKVIRAGIPILASKAVPTDLTVEMAQQYRLTLVCSAHADSLVVYNDPTDHVAGLRCATRSA
jgi:FdhD protein